MKRTLKDRIMGVIIGIIIGATMITTAFAATGTIQKSLLYNNIKITLDGQTVTPKDANGNVVEPFAIDGTTYLPVRAISSALGLDVGWDGATNTVILENPHRYDDGTVTITATCSQAGSKTYKCLDCGQTKTETIPALQHEFDNGTITTAATCEKNGIITFKCKICGVTKTETTLKLVHKPNENNICDNCGYAFPVELSLTAAEIQEAKKVYYISEREIDDLENEKRYRLMFSLLDESEDFLKVPVIVNIKIENDNNEVVYNATRVVKTNDYNNWTNSYGKEWVAAAIYINYTDILAGTSTSGTIYFDVYNDYVSFDPSTLDIYDNLPLKLTTVSLPILPNSITDYTYNDKISSVVDITNITYEVKNDDLYLYFTGEKTFDIEGPNYSQPCYVGWKLYDSDGYIVYSGTFISPNISIGEKFRNEKCYAWDVIKPGESYKLVISDVD